MRTFESIVNYLASPQLFFLFSILAFTGLVVFRKVWTRPLVSALLAAVALGFFGVAMQNVYFTKIVLYPDNVPIVGMLFLVGFFLWVGLSQAVRNDRLIAEGKPPLQGGLFKEKVFVWPDLVYIEFIASVFVFALLIIWSIYLKAPLEQPAHPSKSPNPAKAPWYFLGLQEMLVYFDPWLAGVVFPGLIIVGLICIPFMDPNPKGNGYYTFKERPFAMTVFLFGFVVLWVLLIILGTFLRGPNWNFFGPFEEWKVTKVVPLINVQFHEYFWARWLDVPIPSAWYVRELPGIFLVLFYMVALPPILAKTVFRKFYAQMGFARYNVMAFLFLSMAALPIKMVLRWTLNLKYIVAIPEFFFNI